MIVAQKIQEHLSKKIALISEFLLLEIV